MASTTYTIDTGAGFKIQTHDADTAEHHALEGDRVTALSTPE